MECHDLLYFLPLLPFLWRGTLACCYWPLMGDSLPEQVTARDSHRTLLAALAGFSFAGLLGLVALPGELSTRPLPVWFMLVSFIGLLGALNLQGYKAFRWHDEIGDALMETGTLGMILSVISFIAASDLSFGLKLSSALVAATMWTADALIRVRAELSYLRAQKKKGNQCHDQ
jgi:hypothetical protein